MQTVLGSSLRYSATRSKIKHAGEGHPGRKRHEAPGRDAVETIKEHDGGENNEQLRPNVDQPERGTTGTEEHPRPQRVERKLNKKKINATRLA